MAHDRAAKSFRDHICHTTPPDINPGDPMRLFKVVAVVVALLVGAPALWIYVIRSRHDAPKVVATIAPIGQQMTADQGAGKVVAIYHVTNHGNRDLNLRDVTTDCGCSVASISTKTLKPGRSAAVTVHGTPPPSGSRTVRIQITTDAQPTKTLACFLTMVGKTPVPYVVSDSGPIRFGVVRTPTPTNPETVLLETFERKDSPCWLSEPVCSLPEVKVDGGLVSERSLGEGVASRSYHFTIALTKLPEVGDFVGELTWKTAPSELRVPPKISIHGAVRAPVFASPSVLYANLDSAFEAPSLRVAIAPGDPDFQLEVELVPEEGGGVDVHPRGQEAGRHLFEVTPRKGVETIDTKLVFRTNHPDMPIVKIPVIMKRTPQ